tara:strand:- start:133283 stop:134551 length:1269 start_codon:yes stop_codon:yes gene_type:complete
MNSSSAAEFRKLARLTLAAMAYRYLLSGWRGSVLLLASIFDVFLYAIAIFLAVSNVFGIGGTERFLLTVIGLIAFRWSLSCAIQASRTAHFLKICGPVYRYPLAAALIVAIASPTLVFVISLGALILGLGISAHGLGEFGQVMGWGVFVIAVHLTWNLLLAGIVIQLRVRRWLQSEVPIFLVFGIFLVLSPIAFRFSDLPLAASRIMTSLNPGSHLIAAYQNALWFQQSVSLEVLPLSAVISVAGLAAIFTFLSRRNPAPGARAPTQAPQYLDWTGRAWQRADKPQQSADVQVFQPWRGEMPWLTGRSVLYLLLQPESASTTQANIFDVSSQTRDADLLLDTPLPVYSEWARDRLCIAISFSPDDRSVVLDGLVDSSPESETRSFSDRVARTWGRTRPLTVVTYREDVARLLVGYVPHPGRS